MVISMMYFKKIVKLFSKIFTVIFLVLSIIFLVFMAWIYCSPYFTESKIFTTFRNKSDHVLMIEKIMVDHVDAAKYYPIPLIVQILEGGSNYARTNIHTEIKSRKKIQFIKRKNLISVFFENDQMPRSCEIDDLYDGNYSLIVEIMKEKKITCWRSSLSEGSE
jgi:hypothetical protein